jgi:hypothetical protein
MNNSSKIIKVNEDEIAIPYQSTAYYHDQLDRTWKSVERPSIYESNSKHGFSYLWESYSNSSNRDCVARSGPKIKLKPGRKAGGHNKK